MPTTRAQTAPPPLALLEACLRGNASMVARLLEGPGAGMLQREGPSGLTTLHAAVLGGAVAALPLLVADADDIDACLDFEDGGAALYQLLSRCLTRWPHLDHGSTALALAVRVRDGAAVQQLLRLGASPAAGSWRGSALQALADVVPSGAAPFQHIVEPFLLRGLDPLVPGWRGAHTRSLLLDCNETLQGHLLAHLQGLQEAGQLQLSSTGQAVQLLLGAARYGSPLQQELLVIAGIAALERLVGVRASTALGTAPAAPQLDSGDAQLLQQLLLSFVAERRPWFLQVLLGSRLPLNLLLQTPLSGAASASLHTRSLYAKAALSKAGAEKCRLLHQAGAPLTAGDLYACIDAVSRTGLMPLLACGTPAVDTSQPTSQPGAAPVCYSCPIHRTLHRLKLIRFKCEPVSDMAAKMECFGLRLLEELAAAGYRPCTWQGVPMPAFLQPTEPERVLPVLDPFDLYCPERSAALGLPTARCYIRSPDEPWGHFQITERVLFVARGGGWSPATHHHWPDSFKATARTFLLTAHATAAARCAAEGPVTRARGRRRTCAALTVPAGGSAPPSCCLGDLPPEVLLHILRLAAMLLSSWLKPYPKDQ